MTRLISGTASKGKGERGVVLMVMVMVIVTMVSDGDK
jgi:hypothetical protein